MTSQLSITCSDGTRLAAWDHGRPSAEAPTLVAVHGWPDDHTIWDGAVARLRDRFHVVTYDVRGVGRSDVPRGRSAYRLEQLADDLAAVIDAVSPGRPVHLLGHDWGSIQTWHHVTSDRAPGRVASFTSISGPDLDLAGRWIRSRDRGTLKQLAHSWYIFYFQLPLVPELSVRTGALDRLLPRVVGPGAPLPSGSRSDQRNGLALYRANMVQRVVLAPRRRSTDVPVLVLTPTDDPVVTPEVQAGAAGLGASDLRVRAIPGSHWMPLSHPEVVAEQVSAFVAEVAGGTQ